MACVNVGKYLLLFL